MTSGTNSGGELLVKKILDEMFANIEEESEFNSKIINNLKDLAKIGGLKKAAQVAQILKMH